MDSHVRFSEGRVQRCTEGRGSSGVRTAADILWWPRLRLVSVDAAQDECCRKTLSSHVTGPRVHFI